MFRVSWQDKKEHAATICIPPAMSCKSKRARLSQALGRFSANTIRTVQHLMQAELPRGHAINHRDVKAVLTPPKKCYERLALEGTDGPVFFWAGNVELMLRYVLEASDPYRKLWTDTEDVRAIRLVIYCDECTGGNVLSTSSSKKCLFFYYVVDHVQHKDLDIMWLPHAMIPVRDLSSVVGGMGACMQQLLLHLSSQAERPVLFLGKSYPLEVKAFVGDYDALSRAFMAKSAAGLRPCMRCSNVLAKWTAVLDHPDAHEHFRTISSEDVPGFVLLKHEELVSVYDELMVWSGSQSTATRKEKEKSFGFSLHSRSLLNSKPCRDLLPVHKIVYDSHHCYFANGCAAEELLLFAERMKQVGVTLDMIQESVRETNWVCADAHFRSPSSRSWLLNETWFSGTFYKGSASACWYLLPLFFYYITSLCWEALPEEVACFGALMEVFLCIKEYRRGHGNATKLDYFQRQHQKRFSQVYKECRPKHHFRLHLPSMYESLSYYDCFPCEKKHQAYKASMADDLQGLWNSLSGDLSLAVLSRMLLQTVQGQVSGVHLKPKLAGRVWPENQVEQHAGIRCSLSTRLQTDVRLLSKEDVIFWENHAGRIVMFADYCDKIFVLVEGMHEVKSKGPLQRNFTMSASTDAVLLDELRNLRSPSWWCIDGQDVLCLL